MTLSHGLFFNNSSTVSHLVNLFSVHGVDLTKTLDANNQSITRIKDPENPTDAVSLSYINTINNNS